MSLPPTPPDLRTVLNTPPGKLPRNKRTEALHNREVWWQIYVPVLLAVTLVIGVVALTIWGAVSPGAGTTRVWSQVAAVVVAAQVMIVLLPWVFVFAGLAYGLIYLLRILPPYLKVAQDYTALATIKVEQAMRFVVEPVLKVRSSVAGFDSFVQNVRRFFGHRRS